MDHPQLSTTHRARRIARFGMILILFLALLVGVSSGKELPPREEIKVFSPAYTRYQEVRKETIRLRDSQDWAGLDALAQSLRQSRETFLSGTWLLTSFYEIAVEIPRKDPPRAAEAMRFYESWATEMPQSITAQVCLALAYKDYAWAARGSGWANTVTPEGQRLMDERLGKAWDVLEKARTLEQKCPHWAAAAQGVALGQGWSHYQYFRMVDEAIRQEPTYGEYYNNVCYWLLPRWYGEEGEFEKWIAKEADESPEKDRQYARLVWQVDLLGMPGEMVFAPDRLDWERTKRGFSLLIQEKPESLPLRFELVRLALLADDRATAREQFDVTAGKYWPPTWNDEPELFEKARKFAYADGPNPFLSSEPSAPPPVPARITPQVAQALSTFSHLVGGAIAGILCLIFAAQRKHWVPGLLMLPIFIALAFFYGTLAVALPSAIFLLYLASKEPLDLAEKPPHRWGVVFLWVFLILGLDLGLQTVATILALAPALGAHGFQADTLLIASKTLFASGEGFIIVANALWLSLLLLLVVCGRLSAQGWRDRLGLHSTPWLRALLFVVASGAIILASAFLADHFDDGRTKASMDLMASGAQSPWSFFLALVMLAPAFEELLLRGYAFHGWMARFGPVITILMASAFFALSHVQYGWAGLLHVFVLGLVLGVLRWKTGSVFPCIALHLINNLAAFLNMVLV